MNAPVAGRIAYPGLRAFKREEFDIFFGRENCVDQMVDILAATRFLAVLGTSGSGKSSLVKTGLLNALELGYFPGAGSNWKIADFRPRGRPIRSLAEALLGLSGGEPPKEHEIEVLAAFLRRGPKSLVEWCKDGNLPEGWNLVLIADQFEELFRYEDYSGRQDAEAFVALLIESANDRSVPVHVVITMRSEYLRQCTLIEGLPEAINRGLYLAPRMTREECRQAIVGPAAVCGFSLEPALVNRLLNDLTDFAPWEAGSGYDQGDRLGQRADQLPLMQHVLNLLWQIAQERHDGKVELKLADYEAVNGLAGALNRHADEIAGTIDPKHADVIDVVFRSLVTGKTAMDAIRRPTAFGRLVALAGGRRESVTAVLDAFRAPGRNFIVPDTSEPLKDDTIVDISHESLIRQWRRLSQCVVDEARSAEVYQQLTASAARFADGRGGLLTGLDLANIAAWWRNEKPAEAWASRYGGHFAEASAFLAQSEAAEADRKRREDESQRQLIAGQEAAARSKQLQRLAYGLVGMLLLAVCGAVATTFFYFSAQKASEIAIARSQEAEKSAAAAATARHQAEEAAAAEAAARQQADAAAKAAKQAEQEAENQRRLADEARQRADEQVLASLRIFAGSLADRIDLIHRDLMRGDSVPADLTFAGSLLSEVGLSLGSAKDAAAILLDQLRPALAVQDWYSRHILPATRYSGSDSEGTVVTNAGRRYQAVLYPQVGGDTTTGILTVADRRTGGIVAGYNVPSALLDSRLGRADGDAVILLTVDGRLAAAASGSATLAAVADLPPVARIEDMRRAGDQLQVLFASEDGPETFAALARDGAGWKVVRRIEIGPAEPNASRFAGEAGGRIYAVVADRLIEIDPAAGTASALLADTPVVDARAVGGHVLAAYRGTCDDFAGALPDRPDSWLARRVSAAPVAAASPAGERDCVALLDAASGKRLWQGAVRYPQLQSARVLGPAVEMLRGPDAAHFRVLSLTPAGDTVRASERLYEPGQWQLDGFSDEYMAVAASGAGFGEAFSPAGAVSAGEALRSLATPVGARGSILGWRVGTDSVQAANVVAKASEEGVGSATGQFLEVLAWRHGDRRIARDDFALGEKADGPQVLPCRAVGSEGSQPTDPCRFVKAAFSLDGNSLLVVTNYRFILVGRDGRRLTLDRTLPSNDPGGMGQEVPTDFIKLLPLDTAGNLFLGVAWGNKLWQISRESRGFANTLSVRPIVLPHNLETVLQEAYADPATGAIYLRTRRSIAVASRGDDGGWSTRVVLSQQQDQPSIVGLAPMSKGRVAVLFDDGNLSARRLYVAGSTNAPTAGGTSAADVPTATVGVRSLTSMSAFNDRIVLVAPQASVGYSLAEDGLERDFIVPGEHIEAGLATGEVVAVSEGLQLYAEPRPPKDDGAALVLAEMREDERRAGQAVDVGLGFEILRSRAEAVAGDVPDDSEDFACPPALQIVIRSIDRGLAEGLLDAASNACSSDDRRRKIMDAATLADSGGTEGNDGIVGLLRLASNDDLARAALVNTIRRAMPAAAAAIVAYDPGLGLHPSGGTIERIANGDPADPKAAAAVTGSGAAHGGLDPFDHWLLGILAEREGSDARTLSRALFHYALAERILKAVGAPVPAGIRDRRIALSRILADDRVTDTFAEVAAVSFAEQRSGGQAPEAPTREVSLGQAAAWLAKVQAAAADPESLNPLMALVEEAFGKEQRETDKAAAIEHYRKAMQLYVGTLDDARRLRGELLALGDESAHALAATAILKVIDRDFAVPIVYDVEARREVTAALSLLAGQGAEAGEDFSKLDFGFLDFDYASSNRSVDDSAREFLDELTAAERFFSARLAASPDDPKWLALRGRVRFWMAQIDGKSLAEVTAPVRARWAEGAIADLEAARAAAKLRLWDLFLLAQAYSDRADMLARAGSPEWQGWTDRAVATYRAVIDDPAFADLDRDPGKTYRKRVVFNGLTLALHQGARTLQGTEPLNGGKLLPTDPAYDRAKAVGLAFDALGFAAEREAVVADAKRRHLVEAASANWNLDRTSDFLWGYTVATLGSAARIVDGANGPPGLCDQLATHVDDVDRSALPVGTERLDIPRILKECPETSPRNLYFRARALSQQDWTANAEEVARLLLSAAGQGVAIAYHNLSLALTAGRGGTDDRYQIADDLWSAYSARTLIKAYPDMAPWLKAEATTPERRATLRWLAGKAAALGIPEAHADLGDDPDATPRERALHLRIAERLYAAGGRTAEADAVHTRFAALSLPADDLAAVEAAAGAWQEVAPLTVGSDLERRILDLVAATRTASTR